MKNSKLLTFISVLLLALLLSSSTEAKLVQILHTNDTHSYLDNTTHNTLQGGAARLKSMIESYKKQMTDQGTPTLVLDAGDFLEGNLYYMAQNGRKSFEVHNEIGYDAGTLGNHDYLMGSAELDKMLGEIDLKFSLVVSNLTADKKYKNIAKAIKPYKEFELDGVKIAILGLTTDDMIFRWRLEGGKILDPIDTAKKYEEILKSRKNDLIIALTHIGVASDIKLAEKTKYIDLIVGGHSHTALFKPSYGINKNKRRIPIVQAGMHTEYLGRLVVDIVKGKPVKVISYELLPITGEGLVDNGIKQLVHEADDDLNATYGKEWLNEKLAFSDLEAGDPEGSVKWGYYITDTMREKAKTDIAIHVPSMNGENYPIGDITRRAIFNSIPRVLDLHDKFGWNIYTVKMKGVWLRVLMTALSYHGAPLTISGLNLGYSRGPMGFKIRHIMINGKNINPFKNYTVAFTEGIIKGATSVNPRTLAVLKDPIDSKIKIWSALEERIIEQADVQFSGKLSVVRAIKDIDHSVILP